MCGLTKHGAAAPLWAGKGSECGDAITTHNLIDKVAVRRISILIERV